MESPTWAETLIEVAKRAEMFRQLTWRHRVQAIGVILPARAQIALDHELGIHHLLPIVSNNPFVPPGRELILARGLLAGLEGDFLVATHLLIPQVENSLRYVLRQHGVITSGLNSEGVQEEFDLNRILYMPELRPILGEDLIFELRGLLVERFGSNLRNEMAHGLIDQGAFYSAEAVYLWWTVLRVCCLPVLIARTHARSPRPDDPNLAPTQQ